MENEELNVIPEQPEPIVEASQPVLSEAGEPAHKDCVLYLH